MRALVFLIAASLFAAGPLTDEAVRLRAIGAIFPGAVIETTERRIDSSMRLDLRPAMVFPDALALSPAYRVASPPQDDREHCAARDQLQRTESAERELRFQVFPWPGAVHGELLVAVQYRFAGASPPQTCASLAGLFRVVPGAKEWRVDDRLLLEASHHHHLEGVQFLNLTGEWVPELVVESDSGDAARFQSDLHILMLEHQRFQELLNVPSRFHLNVRGDQWTQQLDPARTLESRGEQFCFDKTQWAENHRRFSVPEVTHPCYVRGTGVFPAGR